MDAPLDTEIDLDPPTVRIPRESLAETRERWIKQWIAEGKIAPRQESGEVSP